MRADKDFPLAGGLGARTGTLELVLVPVDFTPAASAAARRAACVARATGARLALLHLMAPVGRMVGPLLDAPAAALARLRKLASRLEAEFRVPVETHLASGALDAALSARALGDALVVIGNGGKPLAPLKRARTPVLAVRRAADEEYYNVLLPTDLSAQSAHAGRLARRLFPGAVLHVLHARAEGALDEAERALQAFVRGAYLGVDAIPEARIGDPAQAMREYAGIVEPDVVVLCGASPPGGELPCDVLLAGEPEGF